MKFSFRKIASVLASAVMLGSTAGTAFAATAYPNPFVSSGASDGAVVITSGSHAGAFNDKAAALDLALALQGLVTTTTTTTSTATGGDSVKIEKTTDKLNLNNHVTDIITTKITNSEMPNVLKSYTYRSKDNIDYSYEQYLEFEPVSVSDLNFTHFEDDDYKKDTPVLGMKIPSNTKVMNYTLNFKKYPRSDVDSAGKLEDLQDTEVTILGKTYTLLNAYNKSSDTKLELMRGAVTDSINLNEEKTVNLPGTGDYTITPVFIDSDEAQFKIVDSKGTSQTTTKLTKGGTSKLSDGTQIGVTDISYQNFAGGVMSAEFTLGADKLTLENGQNLEVNDEDVNDITTTIIRTEADSNKVDIQKVVLEWTADDEIFVAPDKEAVMPGFKQVKLSSGAVTVACEETIAVKNQGTKGIELDVPIKDGTAKLNILYGNTTDFLYVAGDNDGKSVLRTAGDNYTGTSIMFDRDTDDGFIASWNSTTAAESYYLDVTSITEDTSIHENYTTIQNKLTGTTYSSKKAADRVTIGNVELTIVVIDKDAKSVNITINSGGTFNRVYTPGGMGIWLPLNLSDTGPVNAADGQAANWGWGGLINESNDGTGAVGNGDNEAANTQWMLMMSEEDKDGNLGAGATINVTLGHTSNHEAEVIEVYPDTESGSTDGKFLYSAGKYIEIGDTKVYEGYVTSDLGTKILFKQPTSGTKSAEIVYHCSQMYGNIFLAADAVSIEAGGTTTGGKVLVVKDTEIDSVKNSNLVVVGGSCVNTVAAKILGSETPLCGKDFTDKTNVGAGQYLVKAVASPYNSAKTAVLVAGYEAAETELAVKKLKEGHATDVGTANVYPVTSA